MDLKRKIENFLKQNIEGKKPLLLGFSGGGDSLTLAYCLIQLKIPFELAHFDHRWREKSSDECKQLAFWAKSRSIPFHFAFRKQPQKTELAAREERFEFFYKLFETKNYEALLLAHHQDDQVETVLKRVLEGARLTKLQGMQSISRRGHMPIWRPLLTASKKEILSFIQEHNLNPIDDETNRDPKYLRTRLKSLIPQITKEFGKEIIPSFLSLSKRAKELEDYLDVKTQKYLPIETSNEVVWDFTGAHPIEIEHVLKKTLPIPRGVLERIIQAIQNQSINHQINEQIFVSANQVRWVSQEVARV